ncbi:MAG TPA: DUF58 domain-containing protein [Saprospiraceae bacterium]|nr:DUF58 domain-containing protein [Saprospiraceae bacterium]HPG07671.1 DUF58 domain-containing protein [Saprospiraceae bacterium]HQU52465.1 DUF58 domain-containing protein [Saprospiraceae bacterium]HRV84939.1 DUF58 domain-containing protein [Saprospiraceae bacterium]
MDTGELLRKVHRIEIKTKGLSKHIFSGEYHSAFKGRGMSFSEVRTYQFGDDIRSIDWNVTARTGEPHVKIFEEERELTVMLLVDVSKSAYFGTQQQFKNEVITEICAVLAFSAIQNNDKVGLILFSDRIELYIPPKKGKSHILRIIRELLYFEPKQVGTDLKVALEFLNNVLKKKSIAFLISDFLTDSYTQPVRVVAKRHDLIGMCIFDPREETLPAVGMLRVADPETGEIRLLDTSDARIRQAYEERFLTYRVEAKRVFTRSGADMMQVRTDESYVRTLMRFFKKRSG